VALYRWIDGYNANYLHPTLGYRSSEAFAAEQLNRENHLADAC